MLDPLKGDRVTVERIGRRFFRDLLAGRNRRQVRRRQRIERRQEPAGLERFDRHDFPFLPPLQKLSLSRADVAVVGGTEGVIHPLPIASFAQMQAMSRRNDEPERASRPWDVDRDGFVLAEGAAVFVIETLEHARARGARIYGELAGAGITADPTSTDTGPNSM